MALGLEEGLTQVKGELRIPQVAPYKLSKISNCGGGKRMRRRVYWAR